MSIRALIVGAAAVLAAAGAVVATGDSPSALPVERVLAHRVLPTRAALVCPDTPPPVDAKTMIFAVSPRRSTQGVGHGVKAALSVAPFSPNATVLGSQVQPGVPVEAITKDTGQPSLVLAEGTQAPGVAAAQWSSYAAKRQSGLAATWCRPTSNHWWFDAVDTSVGATTTLVVSNPTPGVAVFDLAFYGAHGPIEAPGARGIPVAPKSRLLLNLARYAPGEANLTVSLHTSRGRVVAALQTSRVDGVTAAGTEWVAPAAEPRRDPIVSAGFAGRAKQVLAITNPGSREALASVQVLAESGPYTPSALTSIRIPPGKVVVKDISSITEPASAALQVTSNVAVTAATRSQTTAGSVDFAVASGSAPLTSPTVVPVLPGAQLALWLTAAPSSAGNVTIESFDKSGQPGTSERLHLTGGSTKSWTLPAGGDSSYVTVSVDSGTALHGVANFTSGSGITSLPLISGVDTIIRPAVTAAPPQ
ncbi:MAG: DUF5719 family protein [Nocardioidaceae bacterium]